MLGGLLSVEIKPLWLTLLMNIPFWPIIYEILFRKIAVSLVHYWKGDAVRDHAAKSRTGFDRVHSAVRRSSRPPASD